MPIVVKFGETVKQKDSFLKIFNVVLNQNIQDMIMNGNKVVILVSNIDWQRKLAKSCIKNYTEHVVSDEPPSLAELQDIYHSFKDTKVLISTVAGFRGCESENVILLMEAENVYERYVVSELTSRSTLKLSIFVIPSCFFSSSTCETSTSTWISKSKIKKNFSPLPKYFKQKTSSKNKTKPKHSFEEIITEWTNCGLIDVKQVEIEDGKVVHDGINFGLVNTLPLPCMHDLLKEDENIKLDILSEFKAIAQEGHPKISDSFEAGALEHPRLQDESWYLGEVTRAKVVKKLMKKGLPTGTFLIRKSKHFPGDFTLSVRYDDSVEHYRIIKWENGKLTIDEEELFSSFHELIQHYAKDADGLACTLAYPNEKPIAGDLVKDEWEIPRESLSLTRKLSDVDDWCHQFYEVWAGVWNNTTQVTVKTLQQGTMSPGEFLTEASIMKNLRHKHLVQLHGICSDYEPTYIVTEYMSCGSLLAYLSMGDGATLQLPRLIDMAAQVAAGMTYLGTQRIVHRNLAARTILVDENFICKVGDYGVAYLIEREDPYIYQAVRFPIKWSAPEAALYNTFTIKSDVWSYGILLMEIVTKGQKPYPAMSNAETIAQIERGYRMPIPQNCPQKLYQIMIECWNKEAEARPTFENLQGKMEDYYLSDDNDL